MTEESAPTALPAPVELAWGLRRPPTKGPRRGLSVLEIAEAGVAIADREGLAAVSMSRVAEELGVSTMALYRYVSAKDELLDLMGDVAYAGRLSRPSTTASWREALEDWAWQALAVLDDHPWLAFIPISGPPTLPHGVEAMETVLFCLRDTGLTFSERIAVLLLISGYVRTQAQLEQQLAAATSSGDPEETASGYSTLLRTVTEPEQFPALHEALDAGVFDVPDEEPRADFTFGLARILDGVAAHIASIAR